MRAFFVAVLVGVWAWAAAARAEGGAVAPGLSEAPWRATASVWTASPASFDAGLLLGAGLDARRRIGAGPFFASARVSGGLASEANRAWTFDHHHALAAVAFGAEYRVGVGRAWAQVGAGAIGIYEVMRRHQYRRLVESGVTDAERTGWTAGPAAIAELGLTLDLRGPFHFTVAGGPTFSRARVMGRSVNRFGGTGTLGVGVAF